VVRVERLDVWCPRCSISMGAIHMITARILLAMSVLFTGTSSLRATECETTIARHMVGEALLAAHFVALAEKAGMAPSEINAILKNVAERSAMQEFWITDSAGHAYLTNTGVDFTFSPDSSKQPQASAFWSLIKNSKEIMIQSTRKREIDNRIFKYVGVGGVDKPRIVQVGVGAGNLCK
jgi:adenylate cyclase